MSDSTLSSNPRFPDPEKDLFSDAMDAAASVFHSVRHGILRNAERAGETTDGEVVVRRSIAAAFNAYVRELRLADEPATVRPEDLVAALAHRACCGVEHDPAQGKLHGCCVVCGVPWPCDTAKYFLRPPPTEPAK